MKYFKIVTILFLLACMYINYNLYQSLIVQQDLIHEFNTQKLTSKTLDKLKNLNIDFPNVTITALPLKAVKANYLYRFGYTEEALSLLDSKAVDNKYIFYKEYLKSQIFYELKDIDSSKFYSKKAYLNLPQNPLHFERLAIAFAYEGNYDSITNYFKYVKHKDIQIWKLYLLSMLNKSDIHGESAKNIANLAINKFPDDNEILIYSNSIKYGKNNVLRAKELSTLAEEKYNNLEYQISAKYYEQAAILNPGMYSYFENSASAYLELGDFDKAIELSSIVLDSFNIKTGKSEFIKAFSLSQTNGNNDQVCSLFRVSYKKGFKGAYPYINKYCK